MNTEVFAKCRVQGRHFWGTQPKGASREYLSNVHRHEFHFEVGVSVVHDDREVEILELKQRVLETISEKYPCANDAHQSECRLASDTCFGERSCEMIARELFVAMREKGYHVTYCIVSEDGENGARVFM